MNNSVESLLKELLQVEKETQRLVRFLALREARKLADEFLTKPLERRIYELSDGIRSSRDIERLIGKEVTQRTVVTWWQRWQALGLVEPSPVYSGRVRKLMSLSEMGLPLNGDIEEE